MPASRRSSCPIGEEAAFRGVVDLLTDTGDHLRRHQPARHDRAGPARDGGRGALGARRARRGHRRRRRRRSWSATSPTRRSPSTSSRPRWRTASPTATVFPVLCGSATKLIGVDRLATFIVEDGPAPARSATVHPAAFVFKTIVDPYVGRVNLFKVLQGTIKSDDTLVNDRTMADERLHQLVSLRGKEQEPLAEVPAGDIAAVAKLADTTTGDVLGARGADHRRRARSTPPEPGARRSRSRPSRRATRTSSRTRCTASRRRTRRCGSSATPRPTRRCCAAWARRTSAIALERLARKFGVEVETDDVQVAYRETITGNAEAEGKLQEADRRARPVRRSRGSASSRRDAAPASSSSTRSSAASIPRQFIPAVEKGVAETDGARRRVRLPGRRREASPASTASTTRSTRRR